MNIQASLVKSIALMALGSFATMTYYENTIHKRLKIPTKVIPEKMEAEDEVIMHLNKTQDSNHLMIACDNRAGFQGRVEWMIGRQEGTPFYDQGETYFEERTTRLQLTRNMPPSDSYYFGVLYKDPKNPSVKKSIVQLFRLE